MKLAASRIAAIHFCSPYGLACINTLPSLRQSRGGIHFWVPTLPFVNQEVQVVVDIRMWACPSMPTARTSYSHITSSNRGRETRRPEGHATCRGCGAARSSLIAYLVSRIATVRAIRLATAWPRERKPQPTHLERTRCSAIVIQAPYPTKAPGIHVLTVVYKGEAVPRDGICCAHRSPCTPCSNQPAN